jgi:hypothetical protein
MRKGLLLCFLLLALQGQSQDILHVDSANQLHQRLLDEYLHTPGDPEMKVAQLLKEARDENPAERSLETIYKLQVALILAEELEPSPLTFELNFFMGSVFAHLNKEYALAFIDKSVAIAQHAVIAPGRKFDLFTNKAGMHVSLMEYDSARLYFQRAIDEAVLENATAHASAMNNLGVFFFDTHWYDSARICFEEALRLPEDATRDMVLYCAIRDNLAQLDIKANDFLSALKTFEYNDSVYYAHRVSNKYVFNKVRLFEAREKSGDTGIGLDFMPLADYIDSNAVLIRSEAVLNFYRFAHAYAFKEQDLQTAKFFYDRQMHLQDSLDREYMGQRNALAASLLNIQNASFRNEMHAHQLEIDKKRLELKTAWVINIASIVGAILIIALLITYIRKRKREHEVMRQIAAAELREKEMQAKFIQQELELKKKDLTNVALHNTQVYDFNQKMIEKLQSVYTHKANMEQHLRSLLLDLQQQNQVGDRSIGLLQNIDSVNEEFYQKLRDRFPDLTKAESELCGYLRINLSNKDISVLKNIEASSVKMSKNRLRKKLGIGPDEDIYRYVQEL